MSGEEDLTGEKEEEIIVKKKTVYKIEGDVMGRRSPGWRIPLSAVTGIGGLIFIIIWLFFYARDYHPYQNLGVILLSILIMSLILGVAWVAWALRNMTILEEVMMQVGGFKARIVLSIGAVLGMLIFLVLWLLFYAVGFDIYQNIAIVIVSALVVVGILGAVWSSWGLKHSRKFDQWL